MTYNSAGLTNVLLACITVINLVMLLIMYQIRQKK
jgi:hypothetical protein